MSEELVKIAVLEQKLIDFANIVNKLDNAIEKISEVNTNITRMLAVHDERIEQCNKSDNLLIKMLEDLDEKNQKDHEAVVERIEKIEIKLEDVSRIKWMTIGTGIVLAVLATAFSTIASGWWSPTMHEGHTHQQNTILK